jgi:hypothetical protein
MTLEMRLGFPKRLGGSFKKVRSHSTVKYCWLTHDAAAHPKEYVKGPDIGSKSSWTQSHYKDLLRDQQTLDGLRFVCVEKTKLESDSDLESSNLKVPDQNKLVLFIDIN